MKEPYKKGVAIHLDPESCHVHREVEVEALTGALVGWVLSSEISLCSGCRRFLSGGRQHGGDRNREIPVRPCGIGDPRHVRKLYAREPRGPMAARTPTGEGR
jgi:hypothetical protein